MRRPRTRKFRLIIRRAIASAAVLPLLILPTMAGALSAGGDKTVNCDDNAVLYCGALSSDNLIHKYDNGDGKNSAQSIHDIYGSTKFGITSTEVHALGSTAVAGTVTKTGNVIVGGHVVATSAMTAGRQPLSGGTKTTSGSTTFYVRSPSVSFTQDTLDAYVVMKSGTFQFAILSSCGNPVVATPVKPKATPPPAQPTPVPNYTITKQVAQKDTNDFGSSISNLAPGTHVIYRITINSTGAATVNNLVVSDTLQSGLQYVDNTLQRDNAAVANPQDNTFFTSSGVTVGSLAPGASTIFTFEAIVAPDDNQQNCSNRTLTNTAQMSATSLPGKSASASVSEVCKPVSPPIVTVANVTPATPTALPSTGPSSLATIFVAVTAAGTAGYYWVLRRRLS